MKEWINVFENYYLEFKGNRKNLAVSRNKLVKDCERKLKELGIDYKIQRVCYPNSKRKALAIFVKRNDIKYARVNKKSLSYKCLSILGKSLEEHLATLGLTYKGFYKRLLRGMSFNQALLMPKGGYHEESLKRMGRRDKNKFIKQSNKKIFR